MPIMPKLNTTALDPFINIPNFTSVKNIMENGLIFLRGSKIRTSGRIVTNDGLFQGSINAGRMFCSSGINMFDRGSFTAVKELKLSGPSSYHILKGTSQIENKLVSYGYVTVFASGSKTTVQGKAYLLSEHTIFNGDFSGRIAEVSKDSVVGKNARFDKVARESLPWRINTLAAKLLPRHRLPKEVAKKP